MTRAILALLALAGCTTAPTERELIAAHKITDIPWPWCTRDRLLKCTMIRQGDQMFMLPIGGRIGDGADVWDEPGKIVKAFSEGE